MKKTLTVNLGGVIFHIDEDAYQLLENYLSNLRLHFRKQEGAQEIVGDIENRISELFQEKVNDGLQVVTLTDVEEVIARMGKPEDFETDEERAKSTTHTERSSKSNTQSPNAGRRKLFRNPDDRILGGVLSGLALYLGWDTMWLRLAVFILTILGHGVLIPVYIVCWIVIPEASTAAEKLSMQGEDVTVENIGKTVTEGFEKVSSKVNNYVSSGKPRTSFQKCGDVLVNIVGFFLKACLVLLAIIFSPVLFVLIILFVVLVVAAIAVAIGGGAMLFQLLPLVNWSPLITVSPLMTIAGTLAGVALVGIPLVGIGYAIFRQLFKWQPMPSGLKWGLFVLWLLGLIVFFLNMSALGWQLPLYGIHSM